jgi:hypothetical protein
VSGGSGSFLAGLFVLRPTAARYRPSTPNPNLTRILPVRYPPTPQAELLSPHLLGMKTDSPGAGSPSDAASAPRGSSSGGLLHTWLVMEECGDGSLAVLLERRAATRRARTHACTLPSPARLPAGGDTLGSQPSLGGRTGRAGGPPSGARVLAMRLAGLSRTSRRGVKPAPVAAALPAAGGAQGSLTSGGTLGGTNYAESSYGVGSGMITLTGGPSSSAGGEARGLVPLTAGSGGAPSLVADDGSMLDGTVGPCAPA